MESKVLFVGDNLMEYGTKEFGLNVLRTKRNKLLAESDWTVMPDSPLSAEKQDEWKIYRQELRDIPSKYSNPPFTEKGDLDNTKINWPEQPTG